MNCNHVQELLPLHVGRDLEEKRAELVAEHVQSCEECASVADEYRETRQLLHLFGPSPVSDAVYAGIRQRVLEEIDREPDPPVLPQLFAGMFRPRISYAFATVLLLVVFGLAIYFIAHREPNLSNAGQQLANNSETVDRTNRDDGQNKQSQGTKAVVPPSSLPRHADSPQRASTGHKTGVSLKLESAFNRPRQSRKTKPGSDHIASVAEDNPETGSMAAEVSLEGNRLARPDAVPALAPITSEEMLRVEMQTKNRNIRIIWFTHPPTKRGSPNKSFKGIPEVRSDV